MKGRDSGGMLLHPAVLAALGLLLLNDHYLKANYSGAATGILSDFAGLAFFPILVVCVAELVTRRQFGQRIYAVAAVACAIVFAIVELSAPFDAFYEGALGMLQAPMRNAGVLAGTGIEPVRAVSDPWDLFALPAAALGPWLARRTNTHQRREWSSSKHHSEP